MRSSHRRQLSNLVLVSPAPTHTRPSTRRRRGRRIDYAVYVLTGPVANFYIAKDHDASRKVALLAAWGSGRPGAAEAAAMTEPAAIPSLPTSVLQSQPAPASWGPLDAMDELATLFEGVCIELDAVLERKGEAAGACRNDGMNYGGTTPDPHRKGCHCTARVLTHSAVICSSCRCCDGRRPPQTAHQGLDERCRHI